MLRDRPDAAARRHHRATATCSRARTRAVGSTPSTDPSATLMTPPWQTATTRLPGEALDDLVDGRVDARAEHLGRVGAELLPAPFDHRGERSSLVARELLHRDVVVGLRVVLDQARRRPRPRGRARPRSARRSRSRAAAGSTARRRSARTRASRRAAAPARGPSAVSAGSAGTPVPGAIRSGSPWRTHSRSISLHLESEQPPRARRARASGSVTLIVVMPIARAGLRLMPRSSRNTAAARLHVELREHQLVDARVGLAQPDHRRLDDHVEAERVAVGASGAFSSARGQLFVSAAVREPGVADPRDRARHRRPRAEAGRRSCP